MGRYLWWLTFVLVLAAVGVAPMVRAARLIDNFGNWTAFTENEEGKTICYLGSAPKKERGKYKRRGDAYVLITHRPSEMSFNVVSFEAGYTYKNGSEVTVTIGSESFALFTDGGNAWTYDEASDKALTRAMKHGLTMVVEGTSSRGTLTTDLYSLKGFTAAYGAIEKACRGN